MRGVFVGLLLLVIAWRSTPARAQEPGQLAPPPPPARAQRVRPRPRDFVLGQELALLRDDRVATRRLLSKAKSRAVSSQSGAATFAMNFRDGGQLFVQSQSRGVPMRNTGTVREAAFSPDGRTVVLAARRSLHVVDTLTSEILHSYPAEDAEGVTFVSAGRIAFRQDCDLMMLDITRPSPPIPARGGICGELLQSANGRWVIAMETRSSGVGGLRSFARVELVRLFPFARHSIVPASVRQPVYEPRVHVPSHTACYLRRTRDGMRLVCRNWRQGSATVARQLEVSHLAGFDSTGERLVLVQRGPDRVPVAWIAEPALARLRRLRTHPRERWVFLPHGRRLVGTGSGRGVAPPAVVVDLAANREIPVAAPQSAELEGVSIVPGVDNRFVLGQERGGVRDLYWVEIPD